MMAYLVCDDVRIGKVSVGSDLLFHAAEERQVDVNRLVGAAIEWAGGRCRAAAS